jgi:tRNA(fMet)-specific endonuclease VapC
MIRYLLDTKPAQDFVQGLNGVPERADAERRKGNRVGICTPVLGELWSGVTGSRNPGRNLQELRNGLSRLIVWPYDIVSAEEFGRIYTELKRKGRPIQQVDIQIAAIAFTLGNCIL